MAAATRTSSGSRQLRRPSGLCRRTSPLALLALRLLLALRPVVPVFEFQQRRAELVGAAEAARLRIEKARAAERAAEAEHEQQQQLVEAQAALEAVLEQHPFKRVREAAAAAAADAAEERGAAAAEAVLRAAQTVTPAHEGDAAAAAVHIHKSSARGGTQPRLCTSEL